jgi:D-lactate dehydrogenase
MVPKLVVKVADEQQLRDLLNIALEFNISVTFRGAGTSLSGQSVTDSVLVMLDIHWDNIQILDDGRRVGLQPGVVGADANLALARFKRKIGPDPASINACKIGGIVANNSSGMCCGTAQNTYQTLSSMRVILADGGLLDTGSADSVRRFRVTHMQLLSELQALGISVRTNTPLAEKIRHKYKIKNTTGYSLNALIDYQDPIEILIHLMVGSEGTLGFISNVILDTVPVFPCRAVSLVLFQNMTECCLAVSALKTSFADAVELIDSRSMASVAGKRGFPMDREGVEGLGNDAAGLLLETSAGSDQELLQKSRQILMVLGDFKTAIKPYFSSDPTIIEELWSIRKGLFPTVGGLRKTGTTVIIEDVAFPIESLATGVRDLQKLFYEFGYDDALIFGHALEGNVHFVFSQGFDTEIDRDRYRGFMDAVCHLVAKDNNGSLKAEHGTGRNMAPYVELEWGAEAYSLMWEIKRIFDPKGILNLGVVLNVDPEIHLKNLKSMPAADPLVDKCIECGFCEPVCPSRDLSLTPRQRIALYREIKQKQDSGESAESVNKLLQDFSYLGVDTCAATGLCEDRCPVGINTGELVKKLRQEKNQKWSSSANLIARHFDGVTHMVRGGLEAAHVGHRLLSTVGMSGLTRGLRRLSGNQLPLWSPAMPRGGKPSRLINYRPAIAGDELVYWPSCAARNFAPSAGSTQSSLPEMVLGLLDKAGYRVRLAHDGNLCCGQPFESKGHRDTGDVKRQELQAHLMGLSEDGKIPILSDTSPCILRLQQTDSLLRFYDPIQFALEHLGDRLQFNPIIDKVALHITCSTRRMGLAGKAEILAKLCAEQVVIPTGIDCCGFAGDKGFTTPELNASALRSLKGQIEDCSEGYSTSLTCEIGLMHHGGKPYSSILYLVDQACR